MFYLFIYLISWSETFLAKDAILSASYCNNKKDCLVMSSTLIFPFECSSYLA